jgi:hypothetical protein
MSRTTWTPAPLYAGQSPAELEAAFRKIPSSLDAIASADALRIAVTLARMSARGSDASREWYGKAASAWSELRARAVPYGAELDEAGAEADVSLVSFDVLDSIGVGSAKCPAGSFDDLFGAVPPGDASSGIAKARINAAASWSRLLDQSATRHRSHPWIAIATALAVRPWFTLFAAFHDCDERTVPMFAAKEQAFLNQLINSGRPDFAAKANGVISDKKQQFRERRARVLEEAGKATIQRLAVAIVLANDAGSSGEASITSARTELLDLRSRIGGDRTRAMLAEITDPTDPRKTRTLEYLADWLADLTDAELTGKK